MLTREGELSIITIDNPPVNALSRRVAAELKEDFSAAQNDPQTKAIILIAAGKTFVAGADITEFQNVMTGEAELGDLNPLLAFIEDSPKPVIAAIHGAALGGGLELAQAAHYRVAKADAQVGQPEAKLGLIPGAGGTQRLPRLAGIANAVEMCAFGDPIGAKQALEFGIVDRLIEGDLKEGALAFAREVLQHRERLVRTRDRAFGDSNPELFSAAREKVKKTRRNLTAPLVAIDAIEAGVKLSFEEGLKKERELFSACIHSGQARGLIHTFFGERQVAKIPRDLQGAPVLPVNKVAVIGAGTMGGGIAMVFANAGLPVVLKEADQAALDRGMATIRKNYETSLARGRFTRESVDRALALIHPQISYQRFGEVDLIVEAVFENLAVKKQVFAELDKVARPGCILASNTSTLDIDQMAAATSRPESVLGLHFFSPANVMRLLEIVVGSKTGKSELVTAISLSKTLRKVGVVVGNAFGFVGNRMMGPYIREAQFLAEEGASPWRVDEVLTEWGMAMGPFGVMDLAGIDVTWSVEQELKNLHPSGLRLPLVMPRLYEMGRFGQKKSAGWFCYDEKRKAIRDPEIEALIERSAIEAGIPRREISDSEILERTLYALINEGAKCLEEKIAFHAVDIDVIYVNGYGFPAYRGGPMFYADTIGTRTVYDRIEEFRARHGDIWASSNLLKKLAETNGKFA